MVVVLSRLACHKAPGRIAAEPLLLALHPHLTYRHTMTVFGRAVGAAALVPVHPPDLQSEFPCRLRMAEDTRLHDCGSWTAVRPHPCPFLARQFRVGATIDVSGAIDSLSFGARGSARISCALLRPNSCIVPRPNGMGQSPRPFSRLSSWPYCRYL